MKTFSVTFSQPVRAAQIRSPDDPAVIALEVRKQALATIESIRASVGSLQSGVQRRLDAFDERILSLAKELAKRVLQADEALVELRVKHFVQTVLESKWSSSVNVIAVHPDCKDVLADWVRDADLDAIELVSDPSLAPGDCRLESGDRGLLASLDNYLDALVAQVTTESLLPTAPAEPSPTALPPSAATL